MASVRRRFYRELLERLWRFLALFAGVYLIAAVGFYFLEGRQFSPLDSFYWGIVTLSTAGYGDIVPNNLPAKLLTMGVLFTQIFLLGYLISVIGSTVNDQAQRRALGTLGTDMRDHTVVLGSNALTQAAIRTLLAAEQRVAAVVDRADEVANLKALAPEDTLFVTYGASGDREILTRVNIAQAHSVIVGTPDDAENLVAVLNIRAMAPNVRIVVSVNRPELRETMRTAGVTYVASPRDMGGRLCASAAFEPDVANVFEDLTTATYDSDVQEYLIHADSRITTQSVDEAERLVRKIAGCLILGYARPGPDGEFRTVLNPPPTDRLNVGDALIVMGTLANLQAFHKWWGRDQGR
ncbi:MAG: NAD-binding protein [Thermoplasmata archaeon]|nr:NAD-binding protein [Thermoplasmata archaeon]